MTDSLEQQYFFISEDMRGTDLALPGRTIYPMISLGGRVDPDFWSEEPIAPGRPMDFEVEPDMRDPPEVYDAAGMLLSSDGPIVRTAVRDALVSFAPFDAQFVPAFIISRRGYDETYEDWYFLHLWHQRDWVDREASEQHVSGSGRVHERYRKIVLDAGKVAMVPENERLMARISIFDNDLLLLHKRVVDVLLERRTKGVLFIPLGHYTIASGWFDTHLDEIEARHPW